MIRLGILIVLLATVAPADAQPTVPIRGRVVDAENGRPLRRARIMPIPADRGISPVLTDDDGRFDIVTTETLSSLDISKAGYATTRSQVDRDARARDRALEIRLLKGSAISGRVVAPGGVTSIGTRVTAVRLDGTGADVPHHSETDDRGEYRIGGLPPGRYAVSVNRNVPASVVVSAGRDGSAALATLLARDPDALRRTQGPSRTVTLQAGVEATDVDITDTLQVEQAIYRQVAAIERERGPEPGGRITGSVVGTSGEPVGGTIVEGRLIRSVQGVQVVGTVWRAAADVNGRFRMTGLEDGFYRIEMRRPGYIDPTDLTSPDPRPAAEVRIKDGSTENLEIVMPRGGAMTGTIADNAGEPLQGVRVSAMRLQRENGRLLATKTGGERLTDDRGHYRVFGLPAGSYLLVAATDALASGTDRAERRGFGSVYYPGTASIEGAQPLQVSVDSVMTDLDITLAPSFAARVAGVARDSAGEPLIGRVLMATSLRSSLIAAESLSTAVGPDGSFELRDVPPGDYVLKAVAERGPGRAAEFGIEYVAVVDRDPAPVTIRSSPGSTLEGRFVAEGVADPPMRALSIRAITTDVDRGPRAGRGPEGLAVHEDGRFYLTGLHGAIRFTLPSPPAGWYLKSMTIGGVEVADTPFDFGSREQTYDGVEIVLSPSGATIAGSIGDGVRSRASSVVAIAFSTVRDLWFNGSRHVKQQRSGANGSFEISGLPPGDYWVAAVDGLDAVDWQSADVLEPLVPSATRVTVREGQTVSPELRLVRRRP